MTMTKDEFARVDRVIRATIDSDETSQFEDDFAMSMADRLEKYGQDTFISPKQWEVIERLEEKYAP